jgi:acetolactate synthase-1/2/3 large subunit
VQEAATIERMGLPIKIFILNNHGHGIIQGTQDQWLNGNHVASNFAGGLPDPDYKEICKAYGIPTIEISNNAELKEKMSTALNMKGATAIIVDMKNESQIYPKLLAGRPIHEPSPFLSEIELKKFMRFVPKNSNLRK